MYSVRSLLTTNIDRYIIYRHTRHKMMQYTALHIYLSNCCLVKSIDMDLNWKMLEFTNCMAVNDEPQKNDRKNKISEWDSNQDLIFSSLCQYLLI